MSIPLPRLPFTPFRPADLAEDLLAGSLLVEERRETRTARAAIAVCILALLGFLGWAALAPVHEVVAANGALVPGAELRRVQHLEGGLVAAIRVAPGDRVAAGQTLLSLDGAQLRAELAKARAREGALSLAAERLRALVAGDPAQLARSAATGAIVDSQQAAWLGDRAHMAAQLDLVEAQHRAGQADLRSVRAQRDAATAELAALEEQLARQEATLASGISLRRERDHLVREMLALRRQMAAIEGSAEQGEAELARIEASRAELVSGLRRSALTQVADLEAQRAEVTALVDQLVERLDRLEITAPIAGMVQSIAVDGRGEVLEPGAIAAEIVPGEGPIVARIDIPAERIGSVAPGDAAQVRVLTFDHTRFGTIDAVIERISPSSSVNDEGRRVYEARLRLASAHLGGAGSGLSLRPGMTISADIEGGEQSVLSYLLKPLRVLADRSLTEG